MESVIVASIGQWDDARLGTVVEFLTTFISPNIDRLWSRESLRWKLLQTDGVPGLLACVAEGSDVVSTVTLAPRRWQIDGETITAVEVGDAYTRPDRQRRGLLTMLLRSALDVVRAQGVKLSYATPNENSVTRLEACGFRRQRHPLLSLERPVGPSDGEVTFAAQRGYEVCPLESDSNLDAFFRRVTPKHGATVARDSTYFKRRFLDNPLARYECWMIKRRSELRATFVLRRHVVVEGRRDLCLADWTCDAADSSVFAAVVDFAVCRAREDGDDCITAWATDAEPDFGILKTRRFRPAWDVPLVWLPLEVSGPIELNAVRFTVACSDNI